MWITNNKVDLEINLLNKKNKDVPSVDILKTSEPRRHTDEMYLHIYMDGCKSMGIPQPEKCIWHRYDLDLWPLTLKTFSATLTYTVIICGKFH